MNWEDLYYYIKTISMVIVFVVFMLVLASPVIWVVYRGDCIERVPFDAGVITGTFCSKWERS